MPEEKIGTVTHFFKKPMVAALELTSELRIGDRIHIHGHTTDFEQAIESMQIEHQNVESAGAGDSVGVQVAEYVRVGDTVYKVTSEYSPACDAGVLWNDPSLGIEWPIAQPVLSSRDASLPLLEHAEAGFVYGMA